MNHNDESLQQQVESGKPLPDHDDARAYRHVFRALQQPPAFSLPDTFADALLHKVERRQFSSLPWEYAAFAAGILVLVSAFVAAVLLTGFRLQWGFIAGMGAMKGLLAFGGAFMLLLHWVDKKLLRPKARA